jgi:hypothetical protein
MLLSGTLRFPPAHFALGAAAQGPAQETLHLGKRNHGRISGNGVPTDLVRSIARELPTIVNNKKHHQ